MTLRVLDLFSGIGGFSLGLERAGMRTVAFCEIDPYCRAVLRKHWPGVPIHEDVRTLHAFDVGPVDLICGGFPCQDISTAGKGAGLRGERSGLWSEYRRLIEECRPSWVIIENVSALRSRGLDQVLGEITTLGYDAEWHCIPASAIGAPHRRDRVWIVAHADQLGPHGTWPCGTGRNQPADSGAALAHPNEPRLERRLREVLRQCAGECSAREGCASDVADAGREPERSGQEPGCDNQAIRHKATADVGERTCQRRGPWSVEPDVGRVANGVPSRVDRLKALGNAVVPQIPEIIGRAILEAEAMSLRPNSHCKEEL